MSGDSRATLVLHGDLVDFLAASRGGVASAAPAVLERTFDGHSAVKDDAPLEEPAVGSTAATGSRHLHELLLRPVAQVVALARVDERLVEGLEHIRP